MMANPTRVAIDDWQLHDLKNADAAVLVQKKAAPARQDVAREAIPPPRNGIETTAPISMKRSTQRATRQTWTSCMR